MALAYANILVQSAKNDPDGTQPTPNFGSLPASDARLRIPSALYYCALWLCDSKQAKPADRFTIFFDSINGSDLNFHHFRTQACQ
jgi:hypothetical protein